MRLPFRAFLLAAALSVGALAAGAAQAASFGASSHRVGGAPAHAAEKDSTAVAIFDRVLGLVGFDLAASVKPVAGERVPNRTARPKECDQAKKTAVAKAESKDSEGGGSSKGKSRTGEPVYLAF